MYTMPVRAIKSILLKEHESFMQSIRSRLAYYLDYEDFMLKTADESIRKSLASCESYEDLESFVGESRRMSLTEWIESL